MLVQLEYENLVEIINEQVEKLLIKEETSELQRYEYIKNFIQKIENNSEVTVPAWELLFIELLKQETEIDYTVLANQIEELKPIIKNWEIYKLYDLESMIRDLTREQIDSLLFIESNMPKFTIEFAIELLNTQGIDSSGISLKNIDDFNTFIKLLLLIKELIKPSQVRSSFPLNGIVYSCCDIYKYFEELQTSIKRQEKEKQILTYKYQKLLDMLETESKKEEIKDINPILSLIEDQEVRNAFLWYVNTHNQKYYQQLQKEYYSKNENSISKYIIYFQELGCSFLHFSLEIKGHLLKMGLETIKLKMQFLTKLLIDKNQIIQLCIRSSLETILEIENLLKSNYIDLELLSSNISLYYDDSGLNNYQENIKTLLEKKINITCLEDKSFMLKSAILIKENIELLEQLNLPITQLRNLSMLKDENLVEKIASLVEVGLEEEIQNNPDILNSDMNLAKRIVIARMVGESISDKSGIKDSIKEKEVFFVPDEKINDYLLDRNHSNYLCQANIIFPEDDRLKETSYSYIVEGIIIPKLRVTGLCLSLEDIVAPSLYSKEEVKKLEKYRKVES